MKMKRKQNQKFSEIKINANPTTQTRGSLGAKKDIEGVEKEEEVDEGEERSRDNESEEK